jgi:hypothetical protein
MTSFDDGRGPDDGIDDPLLLPPEESLDEDEIDLGTDESYSPVERPRGLQAWGTTEREAANREDLQHRLAREEPDVAWSLLGDGIGDASDTDGEPLDEEVGDARAGRLVAAAFDPSDPDADLWAVEAGIDGGGASAEEAAIHVVPDTEDL